MKFALESYLRDTTLGGFKFRRQHPVGGFVVDFFCPEAKLVVELDGDSHAEQGDYDRSRTEWLRKEKGYRVVRFTNEDVYENLEALLERILEELNR